MIKMAEQFIQKAIKKPGSFTAWIQRNYGNAGFVMHGKRRVIRPDIIKTISSGKCPICNLPSNRCICPDKLTKQRARFAKTLIKIGKRRYKV